MGGGTKGIDPNAAGDLKSAEAQALEKNPKLKKLLNTEVYKRLRKTLPKGTLTPNLTDPKDKEKLEAGATYYVGEGDLPLDEAQLMFFAKQWGNREQAYLEAQQLGGLPGQPSPTSHLVIHVVNGQKRHWVPGSTVKYCVQRKTFSQDQYDQMVQRMKDATSAWQATCNIKFLHVQDLDMTFPGSSPPAGVAFTVRKAAQDMNGTIAMSFFPGDGPQQRHLWIFPFYYGNHGFDLTGVLRHELGHIIGFRHEFSRPETPPNACNKEQLGEGIPLGRFDSKSVMQYYCPQAGLGSRALAISALDRQGAQLVYGPPQP
jgi:hypothetical protein